MSVKIKTPTRSPFEHVEFPCGEREMGGTSRFSTVRGIMKVGDNTALAETLKVQAKAQQSETLGMGRPDSQQGSTKFRKRAYSEGKGSASTGLRECSKRGKTGKYSRSSVEGKMSKLPRRFLHGGNINDPLNLNSLYGDEIGRVLNESTPQSSPMSLPDHKQHVAVLIPPNINDPLNLNSGKEIEVGLISPKGINKKKKKHKKRKSGPENQSNVEEDIMETESIQTQVLIPSTAAEPEEAISIVENEPKIEDVEKSVLRPGSLDLGDKLNKIFDKLVSPVAPQTSKPQQSHKGRKRKRTTSDCKSDATDTDCEKTPVKDKQSPVRPVREKNSPIRPRPGPKNRRSISQGQEGEYPSKGKQRQDKFIHGNYNRYYGYRNSTEIDHRLKVFCKSWFEGQEVLDIGCNVGHITLSLARDFAPKRIVGMDIDGKLIGAARKNVQYYLPPGVNNARKFPVSLPRTHGPIATTALPEDPRYPGFPHNVHFMQGSYVLERDELVDIQKEEFDIILVLSVTKWIHLNSGDEGLKRAFRRMYQQLRPGGKLILEPQSWASYKKKKNLTEAISQTFQQIRLRPEHFREYLLSPAVGFLSCDLIDTPFNKSKGFQRPLYLYTKGDGSEINTPRDVTPLMTIDCTPHATPQPSSGLPTPSGDCWGTPSYDYGNYGYSSNYETPSRDWGPWGGHGSQSNTPKFEIGSTSQGVTPVSSCHDTPTHQLHVSWPGSMNAYEEESQHARRPGSSLEVIEECSQYSTSSSQQVEEAQCHTAESTEDIGSPGDAGKNTPLDKSETPSPETSHEEQNSPKSHTDTHSPEATDQDSQAEEGRERVASVGARPQTIGKAIRRSYSESFIQ